MSSRWVGWILAFSLGANAALIAAIGMGWTQHVPGQMPHASLTPPSGGPLEVDEERLRLSAEQRRAFQTIREHWEVAEQRDRQTMAQRVLQWGPLMAGEDLTTKTVTPLLAVTEDGPASYIRRLIDALREERGLLTPGQNKIMTQMLTERWRGFEAMLERQANDSDSSRNGMPPPGPPPGPRH